VKTKLANYNNTGGHIRLKLAQNETKITIDNYNTQINKLTAGPVKIPISYHHIIIHDSSKIFPSETPNIQLTLTC